MSNVNESLQTAEKLRHYVKNYLSKTGKKQEFLANEMGYTPKRFSQLINGRAVLGIDDLLNMCRFFREPVSRFLDNPENKLIG